MTEHKLIDAIMTEMLESRRLMSAATLPILGPPLLPPAPATNFLVITQQPTTANAGQILSPITVEIFDSTGNLVTDEQSSITMSGPALSGTTTIAAKDGVAVFSNLIINTSGTEILTATDADLTTVTTQEITVSNNVAAGQRFAPITLDPSTLFSEPSANAKWIKVKLVGALNGKTVLTKTLYPKHGAAIVVSNLASFKAGIFNVIACDSMGQSATIEQVMVQPTTARSLLFIQQPRVLDENSEVTVEVLDQYGNRTTQADGEQIVLHSWLNKATAGPAPVLNGNTVATVTNGVATFTGLSMDRTGQAHLIARLGSLKPTVSNVFHAGATLDLSPGNNGPI